MRPIKLLFALTLSLPLISCGTTLTLGKSTPTPSQTSTPTPIFTSATNPFCALGYDTPSINDTNGSKEWAIQYNRMHDAVCGKAAP